MTARVTTLKGAEAGAYYVEALPNYYIDSGEPKGHWHGHGARVLGLEAEIAHAPAGVLEEFSSRTADVQRRLDDELDQVHRFTNDWERDASLRLRHGDPTVAGLYEQHGRLHGGTVTRMEQQALDAWWEARRSGETVVLAAPTSDTVARLNHSAQQRRIDAAELNASGRHVDTGHYRLWTGDEVATRRNHRQLHTDQGQMIRNRDQWTITQARRNGDLGVAGRTGTARLPADYVRDHVELAYGQTSHATQGRTVDRSILLVDTPTDVRGIYVPMTRGRHNNDAYIVTTDEQTATDVFAEAITRSWIDRPALARQAELTSHNPHRPGTLPPEALRSLLDQQAQITTTLKQLRGDLDFLPGDRRRALTQHAETNERLQRSESAPQRAHDTLAARDRPFRRRGHETEIADANSTIEAAPGWIAEHTNKLTEIDTRIQEIDRRLTDARQLAAHRPRLETRLSDIDERLHEDREVRSQQMRRNPAAHITNEIGTRPAQRSAGKRWDLAAGHLDQHHTANRHHNRIEAGPGSGLDHSLSIARQAIAGLNQALNQGRGIDRVGRPPAPLTGCRGGAMGRGHRILVDRRGPYGPQGALPAEQGEDQLGRGTAPDLPARRGALRNEGHPRRGRRSGDQLRNVRPASRVHRVDHEGRDGFPGNRHRERRGRRVLRRVLRPPLVQGNAA